MQGVRFDQKLQQTLFVFKISNTCSMSGVMRKPKPASANKNICRSACQGFSISNNNSLVVRKPVFGVFDLVPHKPGCTAIEDG